MKRNYTETIKTVAAKMKVGEILTVNSFPKIPHATLVTLLNRLSQERYLKRVKRGIYAKTAETRLGVAEASPTEILHHEVNQDNNKCFGGLFLFNTLGLTTQIPTTITILNNKSAYKTNVGNTIVRYTKIRPQINNQTKSFVMFLEVIKNIKTMPNKDTAKIHAWLIKTIFNKETTELAKLVKFSLQYPPRVRAILGCLIENDHPNLAQTLKNSLKNNSFYRVGDITHYLKNSQKWGLKI